MALPFATATVLSLALVVWGCGSDKSDRSGRVAREQSASARAQCDREAQTNAPPRETLVGAFDTTVKAVKAEYRKLYHKEDTFLVGRPDNEPLALCYYDVPPDLVQAPHPGPPIERESVVVDRELNSTPLHGGTKSSVQVRGIG